MRPNSRVTPDDDGRKASTASREQEKLGARRRLELRPGGPLLVWTLLGLTKGEFILVLFLLGIITAGGRLPQIADALGRLRPRKPPH